MTEKKEGQKQQQLVSVIHTSCKDCIFAKFNGNKQVDCKLDRLKYHKNIVEVYDEESEFFVVDKNFCLYYRTKELMDYLKIPEEKWEQTTKEQVKIPLHVILLFNKDNTHEELINSLRVLKSQSIQPSMVTVVNKQYFQYASSKNPENYIKPSVLYQSLTDCNFKRISFKNIYDPEISDREIIDLVFDNTSHLPLALYIVFNVGYPMSSTFIHEIDEAVLNKMMTVNFAYPINDIDGMLVSKVAHKKYSGNAFNICLEDKIKSSEENLDKIIFKIQDICPSLK